MMAKPQKAKKPKKPKTAKKQEPVDFKGAEFVLLYWDNFDADDADLFLFNIESHRTVAEAAVRSNGFFVNSSRTPDDHVVNKFSEYLYAGKFKAFKVTLPLALTNVLIVRAGFLP